MDTLTWEEPLTHRMKMERNLNFSTITNEEDEYGFSRKKAARDPMSHRIIEKRRRDRMNNCLADLSRLVPTNYLKKGRGRIEKTEIIEMAIKHLKHLQAHPCKDPSNCEVAKTTDSDHKRQYKLGYHECLSETLRFLVDSEGVFATDGLCVRLINHLQKHFDKVAGGMCYSQALGMMMSEDSKADIRMEVDSHSNSCFAAEISTNGSMSSENGRPSSFQYENRTSEAPELKQEGETNSHHQPQTSPVKVTSQLREMLQNPDVPKDTSRTPVSSNRTVISGHPHRSSPSPVQMPVLMVVPPAVPHDAPPKTEDGCYKFKSTIKHRFNNDLHQYSPQSDDQSTDKMQDDDHNNNKVLEPYPLRPCSITAPPTPPMDRIVHNGHGISNGHAFSPYHAPEMSGKVPDRTSHSEDHTHHQHPDSLHHYNNHQWDNHAETASSCGSNSSPPPNTVRSNGSSSGYSTNGETTTGLLKSTNGPHSPRQSPYSRTPDRLSNRSPSPLQAGVPIFALHPKGTFYIPLTIESSLLIPYMVGVDDLAPVLHPISICVNLSSHSVKVEKQLNGPSSMQYRSPTSYLMDKFHDRYVYPEKPYFYSCPPSPPRNGCT